MGDNIDYELDELLREIPSEIELINGESPNKIPRRDRPKGFIRIGESLILI